MENLPKKFGNISHISRIWTNEYDLKLQQILKEEGEVNVKWSSIAEKMGSAFTLEECFHRWHYLQSIKPNMDYWCSAEDEQLTNAVCYFNSSQGDENESMDWTKIAEHIGSHRNFVQCKNRWDILSSFTTTEPKPNSNNSDPPVKKTKDDKHKKGFWTDDEDRLLTEAVCNRQNHRQEPGMSKINWNLVGKQMNGLRSPQQCYQRWHNHLKPKYQEELRARGIERPKKPVPPPPPPKQVEKSTPKSGAKNQSKKVKMENEVKSSKKVKIESGNARFSNGLYPPPDNRSEYNSIPTDFSFRDQEIDEEYAKLQRILPQEHFESHVPPEYMYSNPMTASSTYYHHPYGIHSPPFMFPYPHAHILPPPCYMGVNGYSYGFPNFDHNIPDGNEYLGDGNSFQQS